MKKESQKSDSIKIKKKHLSEIDIEDPFFNSLKNDYYNFNLWYQNKCLQNKYAYITTNNNKITSFLMLKIENKNEKYEDFTKIMPPKKRLKISTLKVDDKGKKIGRKFIEIIINTAKEYDITEIYITTLNKNKELIEFLKLNKFKFYCIKITKQNNNKIIKENVYIKQI